MSDQKTKQKRRETNVEVWLKSGKYLPECLRDFHDQKDVFKAMHAIINVEGHQYAKPVDWIAGQCYVIDIFLWFMARRGYTLQRTRRHGAFRSLADDVKHEKDRRNAVFASALSGALNSTQEPRHD